jgi:hypothetical protein
MRRLRKYLRLSSAERRLVREAYALVAAMRIVCWSLPFAKVRQLAARLSRARADSDPDSRPRRDLIAWSVTAAGNAFPGGRNCLVSALAAEIMLRRYGYPAELRIGVANPAEGFKAHAWLESDGSIVVGDFEIETYVPLGSPGANLR